MPEGFVSGKTAGGSRVVKVRVKSTPKPPNPLPPPLLGVLTEVRIERPVPLRAMAREKTSVNEAVGKKIADVAKDPA